MNKIFRFFKNKVKEYGLFIVSFLVLMVLWIGVTAALLYLSPQNVAIALPGGLFSGCLGYIACILFLPI